jgi:hypothetical protein
VIGWLIQQARALAGAAVCQPATLADGGEMKRPAR